MKKFPFNLLIFIFVFSFSLFSFAESSQSYVVVKVLKSIFDKPDALLSVDAVAISDSGQYSLASWAQKGKGGRALLRKNNGDWEIVLCGGKDLLNAEALVRAGIPKSESYLIVKKLKASENNLTQSQRRLFDSFGKMQQGIH
jgi:hypothetical protein